VAGVHAAYGTRQTHLKYFVGAHREGVVAHAGALGGHQQRDVVADAASRACERNDFVVPLAADAHPCDASF
jgi:hypothetical protein